MSAFDDLNQALTDLATAISANTVEIDNLLNKIDAGSIPSADVSAVISQIKSLTAGINAEVAKAQSVSPDAPPAPAPTPVPPAPTVTFTR